MNFTKRQLIELVGDLREDDHIVLVALHDIDEGDLVQPMGRYTADIGREENFSISIGDPDTVSEQDHTEEFEGVGGDPFIDTLADGLPDQDRHYGE